MPLRPPMVRNPVVEVYSPGAATGVVTQVERILPHLLEVDQVGVTMVDLSGAEVTLRDLLVVEDLDMEDPAGTTVVLLALREADPEETALSTETVREYAWRIADASREAGLQANRAVVMMINGCSDAEVAACLRGASVRPETIEISLDYLIERDVDIDRRTDGSRSPPRTTPVAPSTPTRSARNTSRTQSSSTPNGNLQELQASISRLQRDMTSLTTSNNDQFSSIQDVVAMISTDNPAGNNPPVHQDPEDEENATCYTCGKMGHLSWGCPLNASKQSSMPAHVVAALQSWYMSDKKQSTEGSPNSDKQ
ncbi:hypothetical protein DYB30_012608 [Aphanomyces astaci]|uniref:CCHC-type domain-containing protein n=1 Tax=Aphanomyces astaci TaxID=112090 RepID=A0A397CRJ4_APHAT|nr:hypothetical protein DYB30_012608 [Aphanomyces astaci]